MSILIMLRNMINVYVQIFAQLYKITAYPKVEILAMAQAELLTGRLARFYSR